MPPTSFFEFRISNFEFSSSFMIRGMHDVSLAASVVVCTRNRSALLADACDSMLGLESPTGGWEILIVDNASTDDTRQVADSVRDRAPALVRVVDEPTVGLSSARNRGITDARGRVIAFLDDDAFPGSRWLVALVDALAQDGVACAGGPVEPLFEGELPPWFSGRYLPYLTVWDLGSQPIELRYNEYPRGANMAFARSAVERFGGFSTHLGRKGKSLLSCEETELCLRFERGGLRTVYVPSARVRHTTPAGRITPEWMDRRFAAQGRSEAIIDWMHGGFLGLVRGRRAHADRVEITAGERSEEGALHLRFQRRALRGYRIGMITAPLTIPRYRPPDPSVELAPWP
jgi:glycosyltransferase involved in cell wall biosynthesis